MLNFILLQNITLKLYIIATKFNMEFQIEIYTKQILNKYIYLKFFELNLNTNNTKPNTEKGKMQNFPA